MNARPKTTGRSRRPARAGTGSSEREPDERGADAEQDEDGHEAERRTGGSSGRPGARSRLAEPLGLDRRDGGEVARDERQHARREERDEARDERDEDRVRLMRSCLEAGELVVEPALELRVERRLVRPARSPPRARLQRHGEQADDDHADARARRAGAARRARSKPRFGGSASTPGPNWSTSAALISLFVSPAAIRSRMNAFIRSATGAFDWSSVVSQTGQTSSASSSAALGGAPRWLPRARRGRARRARAPPAASRRRERALDAGVEVGRRPRPGRRSRYATTLPSAVDEERLREAGHAVRPTVDPLPS